MGSKQAGRSRVVASRVFTMSVEWGIDIRERRMQPEWMDQPDLDLSLHHAALRGLERVNALSRIHHTFWPSIRKLAMRQPSRELRLLDVACGGGDVAMRLVQSARREGVRLSASACDISPTAIEFAKKRADRVDIPLELFRFDVLNDEWPTGFDVIINSLFLHHLQTDAATVVLGRMAGAARHLVLVNDLVRCRQGYLLARFAARLLSRSPIVHSDGPISVKAAFTPSELRVMAEHAGLSRVTISRCWPARMLLVWEKD
jgi:2-polyprenyl-3-methyl-5-hydroxy-6-metoxy-1,4-benzoquinol methylase